VTTVVASLPPWWRWFLALAVLTMLVELGTAIVTWTQL
jgi:ABC-type multidrug transport system permease subunit